MPRRFLLLLAIACGAAGVALASPQFASTLAFTFSSKVPGSPSGFDSLATFSDPGEPAGKPKELVRGDEARGTKRRGPEQLEHAARADHDLRVRGSLALRVHLRAARVRVVARDARLRKAPAHGVLHALRAPPERREPSPAAARTQFG